MIRVESGKKQVGRYSGSPQKSQIVLKRKIRRKRMMKNLILIKLFSMLGSTWKTALWPHTQHCF